MFVVENPKLISFKVAKVKPIGAPFSGVKTNQAIEKLIQKSVQSCSSYSEDIVPIEYHGIIQAADIAFQRHLSLVLSPDHIWLTIAQGIAQHINNNAEKLRKQFVNFEGKEEIIVRRDDFIFGSPENLWEETFTTFSERIKDYIPEDKHRLLLSNFSTTGKVERAASEVVLMECMKSYFDYTVLTMCGIPSVELEGTTDDWLEIQEKVNRAADFLPDWWVVSLTDICDQFVRASQGDVDKKYWNSIYKLDGGSGGDTITGWLRFLIPYTKSYNTNGNFVNPQKPNSYGIQYDDLPSSVCKTPFKWIYVPHNKEYKMEFIAGVVGITQNPGTMSVRPHIGWAVCEK